MAKDCMKPNENIYFRCRKEAAKYNDKLNSRESAAEMLGVSVSSLADYELGNTKVVPVDKVVLMADLYNAPQLQNMLGEAIRPIKKPDVDNVTKIIADSLNNIAYKDDAQIVDSTVRKFYSDMPRVQVIIQTARGA